jgi:hypothetical protein
VRGKRMAHEPRSPDDLDATAEHSRSDEALAGLGVCAGCNANPAGPFYCVIDGGRQLAVCDGCAARLLRGESREAVFKV